MSCHPVLEYDDGSHQILEVDESQHFNEYRALTLRAYVTVVLRGWESSPQWRPRYGPDRERSGVLRIGRKELAARVAADEVLNITLGDSDRIILE